MITQEQLPMVSVPSFNDTHLEEIIIINKLDTAAKNDDAEGVSKILKELLEHTSIHFFDEEKMMKEALFPDFKTHKNEHDRHLKELQSVIRYFEENKETRAIYVYIEGTLAPWLIHHTQTMDTMMATFLNEGLSN